MRGQLIGCITIRMKWVPWRCSNSQMSQLQAQRTMDQEVCTYMHTQHTTHTHTLFHFLPSRESIVITSYSLPLFPPPPPPPPQGIVWLPLSVTWAPQQRVVTTCVISRRKDGGSSTTTPRWPYLKLPRERWLICTSTGGRGDPKLPPSSPTHAHLKLGLSFTLRLLCN